MQHKQMTFQNVKKTACKKEISKKDYILLRDFLTCFYTNRLPERFDAGKRTCEIGFLVEHAKLRKAQYNNEKAEA